MEFNSYFYGEVHSATFEKGSEDAKLYLNIKVNNAGYLENGTIEFQNANFKLKEGIANENIQSIDIGNNKIVLNKINNGSDVTIELPIEILESESVAIDYFSKETTTKFTATYINGDGDEKPIEKEIINKLSWRGTAEAELYVEGTKFVPYAINEAYGVLVQTKVNSSVKDGTLPIKTTNIEVVVPTINETKPTNVKVIATRTEATNGKTDGLEFTADNFSYDQEKGIVNISVSNLSDSISWKKGASDEYLVTYLFEGQDIYEFATTNGIDSSVTVNSNLSLYNSEDLNATNTATAEIKYTEAYNKITDFNISVPSQISKGYIYANYEADEKIETEYYSKYTATISAANLVTSLQFEQGIDSFLTEDGSKGSTTVSGNNYAYNKRIEISEAIFKKLLGEDGVISVKDENGTELGTINKDSTLENGVYSVDISEAANNKLLIETTAPITEGQLEINVVKALKGDIAYSKEQMQSFNKIEMELTGKTNMEAPTVAAQTLLKEPETKVELELSRTDLTTVVKNENVEIRVILDTSSEYNALFINPTLKITLPSYIEEVNLKSTNILLANGLTIKSSNLTEESGKKVINIVLDGSQTEYAIDAEYKGAILVLNTDLTVDTLTPSGEDKVTLEYTNQNNFATNVNGSIEQKVNFVAPTGVVAANGVSNYSAGGSDVLSISDEAQTVEIDTYSDERVATIEGTVINNYSNNISNVSILGRIPSQENKKIDTETDLGSTFTAPLSAALSVSGVDNSNYTIYYSDNQNATRDLEDSNNNWGTTATTSSKSYLIVFDTSYEMKTGDSVEFSYDVAIPEDLTPNNSTYNMYKVYYNNEAEIGTMEENKTSPVIGLATAAGPEAEITLSSATETVREGQIVEMTASITNIGDTEIENATLKIAAPEGTVHTEIEEGSTFYTDSLNSEKSISVGNIAAGETALARCELRIDSSAEQYPGDRNVENTVTLTADNMVGEINSSSYTFTVLEGELKITNISNYSNGASLKKGNSIKFTTTIENISRNRDLSNVTINATFPEGVSIKEAYFSDSILEPDKITEGVTIEGNNISANVGEIQSKLAYIKNNNSYANIGELRTRAYVTVELKVEDYVGDLTTIMTATADGIEEHYSNVGRAYVEKVELSIEQAELENQYIKEGTEYSYYFTITNNGNIDSTSNVMEMVIPEGLSFIEATYEYNGEPYTISTVNNRKIYVNILNITAGTSVTVEVKVKADMLPDENDKEIKTSATLSATSFESITSNEVTAIIEYDPNASHEGGEPSGTSRYRITGTAWLDENMDGQRDSTEQTIANMQVMLLNRDSNAIVKDPDTNENKITNTSNDGTYQFTNLPNGRYVVVFVYDSSNYTLTEYQKDGVSESFNSDAIDVNLTLNGERRIAGITDVLTINDGNVRNIDIGLYTASRFDLRLDKYIDKITLTTPTIGTNTYEYNNSQLAKIEILNQNVDKSSMVVEYKIVVRNEGSVAGYVNKIVDYLPEEVSFNTELNPDWYLSDNGNIYNASLANERINPGETKEVTLIVSIRITEDLIFDTINNSAEIYECYNEQGLQDIDSTPANNVNTEDDFSKADLIISLVTGKIIMYTAITLVVIAILGFSVYEIKKRVLVKNVKKGGK